MAHPPTEAMVADTDVGSVKVYLLAIPSVSCVGVDHQPKLITIPGRSANSLTTAPTQTIHATVADSASPATHARLQPTSPVGSGNSN